ncbi:hypothetical protein V8C26DRAFT_332030 [Trichoderma gracile]
MEESPRPEPLPVVRFVWRKNKVQKIRDLRKRLHRLRTKELTPEAEANFYASLIRCIFHFVGTDSDLHPECFEACVKLCWDTEAIHAKNWLDWKGYFDMAWFMLRTQVLTKATNLLHCPPAPMLLVVIGMRQVILHDRLEPNDQKAEFLRRFDCNRKAITVINFFRERSDEDVLALDQPWDISLEADRQARPNREIDGAIRANRATRDSTHASHRQDEQILATPASNHRQHLVVASTEASRASVPIARPSRFAVPVHGAAPARRLRKSRMAAFKRSPDSTAEARNASPKLFVTPLPFRLAATPAARRVRSPPPPPTPVPVPIFSSPLAPTPVPVKPKSVLVRQTTKRITRAEVMVQVRPLVNRLKHEGWNGNIQTDIMRVLTDKNVRVLPYFAKQTLRIWAEASHKHTIVDWLGQAKADIDVFEWVESDPEPQLGPDTELLEVHPEPEPESEPEMECEAESEAKSAREPELGLELERQSEAEAEPAPRAVRRAPSTLDIFHDLEAGIANLSEPTAREQLQANLGSLKAHLYTNDLIQREEMQHRVDRHDEIIKVLQAKISGTQQTAVDVTTEAPEMEESLFVTDSDEEKKVTPSVAQRVVIVIDSDEEATEEQQRERKKKKKSSKSERGGEGGEGRRKRKRKSRMAKTEQSDAEVVDSEEERRAQREAKKSKK